jgi:F-box protein 21
MPNATERSLAALDLFALGERVEGDMDDIFARLDSYAAAVREAHADIDEMTARQKATTIAAFLLQRNWVGISDDRPYHSLDHMFLGVALFSSNRNSVPLISAVIYCYVVREFGLQAQPISYPFHVHALVTLPRDSGEDLDGKPLDPIHPPERYSTRTHLFMDPFNSAEPVPISSLRSQLRFIVPQNTTEQIESYLAPASATDLTVRAAHNILAAPSHYNQPPLFDVPVSSTAWGALLCLVLLPTRQQPGQLMHHLHVVTQHHVAHFDHDVRLFQDFLMPIAARLSVSAEAHAGILERLYARDLTPKTPKVRSGAESHGNDGVRYRVGQVFRHRMRGYLAVIYGWDAWCRMEEQWIVQNSVDRLPNGRNQPFYNVL